MIRRSRRACDVLEAVWERLEAADRGQELDSPPQGDCRLMPADGEPFLAELQEQFGHDRLVEAGIATEEEGTFQLSARLSPGVPVVALHGPPGNRVFDFLLPDGLILGEESLIYGAAHDNTIQNLLRSSDGML